MSSGPIIQRFWPTRRASNEVERWQEKLRRRDLLSDLQTRFEFFDGVVPPHVFSGPTFDLWTRRGQGSNWHELELPDERLWRGGVVEELLRQYGENGKGQ